MKLWSHGAASKIAATATALAVTGAFGVGAYALTQDGAVFDPSGFTSAYGKGADDSQKGYQATPESADAAANRHNDASSNNDRSAEESPSKDAFSELPNNGKGTTAVSVDANAKPGTSTVVDDPNAGGSDNGSGNGGGNPTGPVVDNGGDGNGNGGDNGSGGDNDSGGGSGSGDNGGSTTPSNPGGGNGGGAGGNGSGGSSGSGGAGGATTPTTPDAGKAPNVQDPEPEEKNTEPIFPGAGSQWAPIERLDKDVASTLSPGDFTQNNIGDTYSVDSAYAIYKGQTISAWTVFCAIRTSFDYGGQSYKWQCTRDKFDEYQKHYFKIVSVDWGKGEQSLDEPVSLPTDAETAHFKVAYTFTGSEEGPWFEQEFDYSLLESRIYIATAPDAQNDSEILWTVTDPEVIGDTGEIALSRYLQDVLRSVDGAIAEDGQTLNKMMLNWRVDGKIVTSDYFKVTPGKHVITPGDIVDIDKDQFSVELTPTWIDSNKRVDPFGSDTKLVYWQTLVGVGGKPQYLSELDVPEGIQAVDIQDVSSVEPDFPGLFVDTLKLSSTIQYVNSSSGNFAVEEAFEVAADNPYCSATNGMLTSIDGAEILDVPTGWSELVVPEGVTSLTLNRWNEGLNSIEFSTKDASALPIINGIGFIQSCDLIAQDEKTCAAIVAKYAAALTPSSGNAAYVTGTSEKLQSKDGVAVRGDELVAVTNEDISIIKLQGVTKLAETCFHANTDVSTLVLESGVDYSLAPGCFAGAENLQQIVCWDETQLDSVASRLAEDGVDGVSAVLASTNADGYSYYPEPASEGEQAMYTLLCAPGDVVSFDGHIIGTDGSTLDIGTIAPEAFKDCATLKSAVMDKCVSYIGLRAFAGCTNLESLFIDNEESITIESDALQNCASLRVAASNAYSCTTTMTRAANDYCTFWCPGYHKGYNGLFTNFTTNVNFFSAVDLGDNNYVLFADDWARNPYICLQSTCELPSKVELPDTTKEIFTGAFAGVDASFEINWDELTSLGWIDDSAFEGSGLTGVVALHGCYGAYDYYSNSVIVFDKAFNNCSQITSISSDAVDFSSGYLSFGNCTSLETVELACDSNGEHPIEPESWNGCTNLASIELTGSAAPALKVMTDGTPFSFNDSWTDGAQHIEVVDSSLKNDCIDKWIYAFAGYNCYADLYTAIRDEMMTVSPASDDEVKTQVNAALLEAENKIRSLIGMEATDTLTVQINSVAKEGVVFNVDGNKATLVKVPSALQDLDLGSCMPAGCSTLHIDENSFDEGNWLSSITLPDKDVDGSSIKTEIESNAFSNCYGITLNCPESSVPDLLGGFNFGGKVTPFDFGCYSMAINVPQDALNDYLELWDLMYLGCSNGFGLYWYAIDVAWNNSLLDDDEISAAVNNKIREGENYFRSLIAGADLLDDSDDPAYLYDHSIYSSWFDDFSANDANTGVNPGSDSSDGSDSGKVDAGVAVDGKPGDQDGEGGSTDMGAGDSGDANDSNSDAGSTGGEAGDRDGLAPEPSTSEAPTEPEDAAIE